MRVDLSALVRYEKFAQNYKSITGLEDACQSMCCANQGKDPAAFTGLKEFVEHHGNNEASPFFAMSVAELVGHRTACGSIPNSFKQDFVSLIKNHGATTVVFFADFSGRDILDATANSVTVELCLTGGGYDADCDQLLCRDWRDNLSAEAIVAVENAGATTLAEAHEALSDGWSWRPESSNGWTVCESE